MEQSGEYDIAAPREDVWAALNDADTLAACIPGCLAMQRVAEDEFEAKVKAKVGPVSATFNAQLQLRNIDAPNAYTIEGNVKGGAAGFGKGSADVALAETPQGTRLSYAVKASVGGKLAQIGSRLVDGAARKMADDFFAAFSNQLNSPDATASQEVNADGQDGVGTQPDSAPQTDASDSAQKPPVSRQYESSGNLIFWGIAFAVLALAIVLAI